MSTVNHGSSVQGHSNVGTMPSQENDRFLQQAGGELTQQDRQEGYELPEAFAERTAPAAPAQEEKPTVLPASSQPYQSRPSGAIDSHGRTRLPDDKTKASKRAGGARRRPRKQLKWWQKPKTLVFLGGLFILIALGVGLGAGLGIKKNSNDSSDSSTPSITPSQSTVVPAVSRTDTGGITVSQSGASVEVATATADLGVPSSATLAPAGARAVQRWV